MLGNGFFFVLKELPLLKESFVSNLQETEFSLLFFPVCSYLWSRMTGSTGERKILSTQTSNTTANAKLREFPSNICKIWASQLSNEFQKNCLAMA